MAKKTNEAVVEEVKPAVTEARATAKTVRISARKVRYVLALVRGKDVEEALGILKFTPNGAADESKLYIKECYANEGFTIKRFMPRAKGSASAIMKRTSHITVVVAER